MARDFQNLYIQFDFHGLGNCLGTFNNFIEIYEDSGEWNKEDLNEIASKIVNIYEQVDLKAFRTLDVFKQEAFNLKKLVLEGPEKMEEIKKIYKVLANSLSILKDLKKDIDVVY